MCTVHCTVSYTLVYVRVSTHTHIQSAKREKGEKGHDNIVADAYANANTITALFTVYRFYVPSI